MAALPTLCSGWDSTVAAHRLLLVVACLHGVYGSQGEVIRVCVCVCVCVCVAPEAVSDLGVRTGNAASVSSTAERRLVQAGHASVFVLLCI
jgi:hypothetical protein